MFISASWTVVKSALFHFYNKLLTLFLLFCILLLISFVLMQHFEIPVGILDSRYFVETEGNLLGVE